MKREADLDALIFDYLEGNLSVGEREAFDRQLQEDEKLQTELQIWQKTYLSEDLPDTSRLDELLLRPENKDYYQLFLNSFLFLAVVFIILPGRLKEKSAPNYLDVSPSKHGLNLPSISPSAAKEKGPGTAVFPFMQLSRKSSDTSLDQNISEGRIDDVETLKSIEGRGSEAIEPIFEIPTRINRADLKSKEIKSLSKAEIRKRNRLIRKTYTARKAGEFRKGRIPYVVPLDNKNF
jgi:hypothetical protein